MANTPQSPSDLIEKGEGQGGQQIITGAIKNALPAPVMRRSMENKNILAQKGSVYVGTGQTFKVIDNVGGYDYSTAETLGIGPADNSVGGSAEGYVLFCVGTNNTFPDGVTPTADEERAGVKWITLRELKNALASIN